MKIAIIGGKLQGVEAAYLARKAGWKSLVIDKNSNVPASGLSDGFVQGDITETGWFNTILKDVELVIPATENIETLNALERWSQTSSIPLVFDSNSYRISSSKLESNRIFAHIGVPVPLSWPKCGFPLIAKPSTGSGSEGVKIFHNLQQFQEFFPGSISPDGWVLQEYMEGPSFSLEVVGSPGNYQALQVTDLEMDAGYDCKRVSAPTKLSSEHIDQFKEISLKIAEAIQLRGLMDVEVILHNGQLKVLEIDARLPSQTPTVVYLSSGCNILNLFMTEAFDNPVLFAQKGIIYEHIKVGTGVLEISGEHIMEKAGLLHLHEGFFGADEAITNYITGRDEWVATLIISGPDREKAWAKREQVINEIKKQFDLDIYNDPIPIISRNKVESNEVNNELLCRCSSSRIDS